MKQKILALIDSFRKNPPPLVTAVRLSGVIGPSGRMKNAVNLENTEDVLKTAFSLPKVKAVALSINSPGGSPVQSALILKRIRDLANEKDVPVLAFCEDVAASGGYMLALAGDEIYAHEASIVGSIGVVSASFGFHEAIRKLGIERRLYAEGERKAMLDPFSPEDKDDVARLKDIQKEVHEFFKARVRARRGKRLKGQRAKIYSGDIWTGTEAKKLGVVDAIGDMRAVLRDKFGENVRIRTIASRKPRLAGLFGMGSRTGVSGDFAEGLIDTLEERSHWQRWGL